MILVDTSVWIAHLRDDLADLRVLLDAELVLCHPFVVGELACGNLRRRTEVLSHLARIPHLPPVSHGEAMALLERRRAARGLGWIDTHLLASVIVANARLWTMDRRLAATAASLHVAV